MRLLLAAALVLSATAATHSDAMVSLRFLVGNWTCTYHQGAAKVVYKATYAYDMSGNWLRERDTSALGDDEALFTYRPKERAWIAVVVAKDRSVTLFRGTTSAPGNVVYRSTYPDTSMTEHVDRASPTRYTIHFSQTTNGKTLQSMDVCTRS